MKKREEPSAAVNALSRRVIGAALEVHRRLGPGLPESVYENALCLELEAQAIPYRRQVPVEARYRGVVVGEGRVDLLVADALVVELKAVEAIKDVHLAQVLTYLKMTNLPLGLLINFGVARLKNGGIRRVVLTHPPS